MKQEEECREVEARVSRRRRRRKVVEVGGSRSKSRRKVVDGEVRVIAVVGGKYKREKLNDQE